MRRHQLLRAGAVALGSFGLFLQTVVPGSSASADVCTDVGNTVNVSTCADLSDIVGAILTPGRPDRGPGNLTPNLQTCLGWDGRWVEADSCT